MFVLKMNEIGWGPWDIAFIQLPGKPHLAVNIMLKEGLRYHSVDFLEVSAYIILWLISSAEMTHSAPAPRFWQGYSHSPTLFSSEEEHSAHPSIHFQCYCILPDGGWNS